jgi:hypothetical protein
MAGHGISAFFLPSVAAGRFWGNQPASLTSAGLRFGMDSSPASFCPVGDARMGASGNPARLCISSRKCYDADEFRYRGLLRPGATGAIICNDLIRTCEAYYAIECRNRSHPGPDNISFSGP